MKKSWSILKAKWKNSKGSKEAITLGVNLDDGIIKTTKNTIRKRLGKSLVDNGHKFKLSVRRLYKPTKG